MPVEEYINSHMTGKEDTIFWMNKFRVSLIKKPDLKTVMDKQQHRQWNDDERNGQDKLQWYDANSPYADPMYNGVMKVAEGKIRLTESDLKKIVTEVVKRIITLQ